MEPAASTISRDIAEGSSLRPSCEFPSPHSSPVAASLRLRSCARRRRSWKEGEERGRGKSAIVSSSFPSSAVRVGCPRRLSTSAVRVGCPPHLMWMQSRMQGIRDSLEGSGQGGWIAACPARAPSITVHHRPSPHRSSNINVRVARIGNHLARIFAHVRRTGAQMLPAHRSDRRWAACCGGLPAAAGCLLRPLPR
jgi:hypothetical protein